MPWHIVVLSRDSRRLRLCSTLTDMGSALTRIMDTDAGHPGIFLHGLRADSMALPCPWDLKLPPSLLPHSWNRVQIGGGKAYMGLVQICLWMVPNQRPLHEALLWSLVEPCLGLL